MPYSGITSKELCALLGLSRQMLKQSGISAAISKQFPFGAKFPLYDEHESNLWKMALNRRKSLIAFGKLNDKSSLLNAVDIDPDEALDCKCKKCGGWAYAESINFKRAWCPSDGIVNVK